MSASSSRDMLCPSAPAESPGARVIGVVTSEPQGTRVTYVRGEIPVTAELLESIAPVVPTQVLRVGARCQEGLCRHFDGTNCGLAVRIAAMLPEVVDTLPPCLIRGDCRWYAQEGRAACLRCPQVMTYQQNAGNIMREVAEGPATT